MIYIEDMFSYSQYNFPISFRSDQQTKNFFNPAHMDNRLHDPILVAMMYLIWNTKLYCDLSRTRRPICIITQIQRSLEEQDKIYLNHPDSSIVLKYQKSPWFSVHNARPSCGGDIVFLNMQAWPESLKKDLVDYVERFVPYGDGKHKTLVIHDCGSGLHCHFQCKPTNDNIFPVREKAKLREQV